MVVILCNDCRISEDVSRAPKSSVLGKPISDVQYLGTGTCCLASVFSDLPLVYASWVRSHNAGVLSDAPTGTRWNDFWHETRCPISDIWCLTASIRWTVTERGRERQAVPRRSLLVYVLTKKVQRTHMEKNASKIVTAVFWTFVSLENMTEQTDGFISLKTPSNK